MGLEMSTDGGWVMVSDVKEGQAAAQHGVLKGSYILEVNGEKCDGLVQADVTNLLRKAGAREVLFALPLRKK
jgi:C-terminal processing protease CtpA/Prc